MDRRERIEALLRESEELEDTLGEWQRGARPTTARIREVQRQYHDWYAEARELVGDEDRARFDDMYEGGTFTSRIRAFLTDPVATNPFYDETEPNPLIEKWANPFERTFRDNAVVQRELLVRALHTVADVSAVLDELTKIFRRLPDFLAALARRNNAHVPVPTITNEADLQVLVEAILRLHFDDVRAEDPVPQQAGGASRVDFLLRAAGVVMETKMTRQSMNDRALGEELLVDWGRYPRHPDCRAIFALVYDPDRRIANAAALEHDLSQEHTAPATRVVVVRQ